MGPGFRPVRSDVMSRKWAFYVNTVAASPLVDQALRRQIYLRNGIEVATDLVYPRCYFHTANISIGPEALLNHGVHIENVGRVEIGARTALGIYTTIVTSTHRLGGSRKRAGEFICQPVTIGTGNWIGAGTLILPGVTIGNGCLIAAGAVVTRDCDDDGLYAGVPAQRIRDLGLDETPT